MTDAMLRSIDIQNFRSIRGSVHAPLDAKVILVHGENGAGKTSLLSAIELALTGRVGALERADPTYTKQLLHRDQDEGRVVLTTTGLEGINGFETVLTRAGLESRSRLPSPAAGFFNERCYLPQALLGQLLQIYQDSDSSPDSPLARFVTELLGLDKLDAIETGLAPVGDLRNFRKVSPRYMPVESEKQRLQRLVTEHVQIRDSAQHLLAEAMAHINEAWTSLKPGEAVSAEELASVAELLAEGGEEAIVAPLVDQRRTLQSLRRELTDAVAGQVEPSLAADHKSALNAFDVWRAEYERVFEAIASRVRTLLPALSTPPDDTSAWLGEATRQIEEAQRQAGDRSDQALSDKRRRTELRSLLEVERKNLSTVDHEIALISDKAGTLAELLAEISGVIDSDVCPVCDRDFAGEGRGSLIDHVHQKVRRLSGSAERLLSLGRNRATQQEQIDRLAREDATLVARELKPDLAAELARRSADLTSVLQELHRLSGPLTERVRLATAEVTARRKLTEHQSRVRSRAATAATLATLADSIGEPAPDPIKPLSQVIAELEGAIDRRLAAVRVRDQARRVLEDQLAQARLQLARLNDTDAALARHRAQARLHEMALRRANRIRSDGQKIRDAVEAVRARIISREFNDRLNRLWRDLFIRLAPGEPFVPAFHIPDEPTRNLKPKLITRHRSGGSGGTPGAMLSAGNLNTAALTLFLALHMTVAPQLPWLILDDPVQSMDDVHIAHFAALLRTLSKEHGRQVIVAVHDRQLFEYLRLELSPAYQDDSLLTLELTRNATLETSLLPNRVVHQPETALRFAA